MSDTTAEGIRVQVQGACLEDKGAPSDSRYRFAWRVRTSNVGAEVAQLISRKWIITDGDTGHGLGRVLGARLHFTITLSEGKIAAIGPASTEL